ncbi:hypothetical protein Hanom_Chr17g01536761 [Helianthus anomalus]
MNLLWCFNDGFKTILKELKDLQKILLSFEAQVFANAMHRIWSNWIRKYAYNGKKFRHFFYSSIKIHIFFFCLFMTGPIDLTEDNQ